jgi:VWFA-related protein
MKIVKTWAKVALAGTLILAVDSVSGVGQEDAGTRLVDLNVVAVDGRGQPVGDLNAGDFQLTDAGKPQKIAFFHHNDIRLQQPLAVRKNEFSNRSGVTTPHVTVILFDLLNERFGTRGYAANQIVHDLESMESPDDLFLYLLTVDAHLYPVHGFPEGSAAGPGQAPWTRQIKPLLDDAMKAVLRVRPVDIDVAARVPLTYTALGAVAAQLSRFPGRKNVVWVTDGVPITLGPMRSDTGDVVDFTPQLRQLSEALDRWQVAIYPVRQVMLGSENAIDGGTGVGNISTLDEFAGMTGGRPDGGKDISAAVRQAMNDVRTSYQLGYYAPARNWDGKFHKLRVTCSRRGVRIQARTGYYAWQEPPGARAQRAIDSAIANDFDAAGIGMRGFWSPDPQDAWNGRLEVHIDADDVALAQAGESYSAQLRVAIAIYVSDGRIEASKDIPLDVSYSAADRDKAPHEGIGFVQNIRLSAPAEKIRIVVFDRGSNAVGSMTIPTAAPTQSRPR